MLHVARRFHGIDADWARESLARLAGLRLDAPVRPTQIAALVLGPNAVRRVDDMPNRAALQLVEGHWFIYVRHDVAGLDLCRAVAHELGEWWLAIIGYDDDDLEEAAESIADVLVSDLCLSSVARVRAAQAAEEERVA